MPIPGDGFLKELADTRAKFKIPVKPLERFAKAMVSPPGNKGKNKPNHFFI